MDHSCDYSQMLNMIPMPAFTVRAGSVAYCNQQAAQLMIEPGMPVEPLLATGAEEYGEFLSGCLYLDITLQGNTWAASITKLSEGDLFCLESPGITPELKAMSLLCSQLRIPLSGLSVSAEKAQAKDNGEMQRNLDQINRILCNVSNAHRFALDDSTQQQEHNICAVLDEQLQECRSLLQQADICLEYELPQKAVHTALDPQMLRQAVYNLLDNASLHTAPGGRIRVTLALTGRQLRLSVADNGTGIAPDSQSTLFRRYARQPGIEDGLNGVGLGMTIIRTAASAHRGTVLVEQPQSGGTRVTMTIGIRPGVTTLRSKAVYLVTSKDDGKIMLSNVLPTTVYKT